MNEKVYVTVKGLHFNPEHPDMEEDVIEVINVGVYKLIAGNEYIKYDEVYDSGEKSKTIIKLHDKGVEITKKGELSTHMSFIPGEKTVNLYETPFGNVHMGIYSKSVDVIRQEEKISIKVRYSLEINCQHISDSSVEISVQNDAPNLL